MSGLKTSWAIEQLDLFISDSSWTPTLDGDLEAMSQRSTDYESRMAAHAAVVEKILDRVDAEWRDSLSSGWSSRWAKLREVAIRAREGLVRADEIRQNLGDDAPEISAASLHPWVWSGASSLWQSGHFREAVEGAIRKLNAETQNKVGRRDVSETDLFNQAFSEQAPNPRAPRLNRMEDDGSKTFKSVQRGARSLAEGVFAGIRNPLAHEASDEMPEQRALEYLAALSVLARWVDDSTVVTA